MREFIIGYANDGATLDRMKPMIFVVDQGMRVRDGLLRKPLQIAADSPLHGRAFGSREPLKEFRRRWKAALDAYLLDKGIGKRYTITAGCVIERMDGQRMFWRNFDKSAGLMKLDSFRNIRRIIRSPLAGGPNRAER